MKLLKSTLIGLAAAGEWSYPEDGGHWDANCVAQAAGSPINLDYTYRNFHFGYLDYFEDYSNAVFQFNGYDMERNWQMSDNGHSITFTVADEDHVDTDMQVHGGHLERPYNFHSFHMHWGNRDLEGGSEHTVNGKHYFAELHLVHYGTHCGTFGECVANNDDGVPVYNDGLAVLGVFIELDKKMDRHDMNDVLEMLVNKAVYNQRQGIDQREFNPQSAFSLGDLVGSIDTDAFYRYQGSLTTPSCNEVVRWTVFKDTLKINRFLARQFLRQVGHDDTTLVDNFRGVQPLADRPVTFWSTTPTVSKLLLGHERRFDAKTMPRHEPQRYDGDDDH